MTWISATALAKQFDLPHAIAGEIVGDALRHSLFRSWGCWAWLVIGLASVVVLSVAVGRHSPHHHSLDPFAMLISLQVVMPGWRCLGQWLAGPRMLAEAEYWSARRSAP